jgi:hypothetical protein
LIVCNTERRSAMTFSEQCLRDCWHLAQARCECQREKHEHAGRCPVKLVWEYRGKVAPGGWYPCAWTRPESGRPEESGNVELLCWRCYAAVMADEQ